ncbi:hypothetical protein CELL_02918 [Cellulomonas sp. T2.31MG-18]|uniref:hypothetical protein n=1 Tax=Cellulomonas sp. T2.31MG-18 TaxID=3157619 RepID=UPI0035EF12A9
MTSVPRVPERVAPSSVLAQRIAVDLHVIAPPPLDILGLTEARMRAFEWQHQRSFAVVNDMHGALSGQAGARWVLETHGIFGVVAEQVLVAIEAEVEKAICQSALDGLPNDPSVSDDSRPARRAHYLRSLRFFAEGQANALVVGLHGLGNLVLRSLEFARPLDAKELRQFGIVKPNDFAPGSSIPKAWISLDLEKMSAIAAVAADRGGSAIALAEAIEAIRRDPDVVSLFLLRNAQYHRWRGESPGVTGIALGMPTVTQRLAAAGVVSFGHELLPPYEEGDVTVADLARQSRAALDALVRRMESFHRAWWDLFADAFHLETAKEGS